MPRSVRRGSATTRRTRHASTRSRARSRRRGGAVRARWLARVSTTSPSDGGETADREFGHASVGAVVDAVEAAEGQLSHTTASTTTAPRTSAKAGAHDEARAWPRRGTRGRTAPRSRATSSAALVRGCECVGVARVTEDEAPVSRRQSRRSGRRRRSDRRTGRVNGHGGDDKREQQSQQRDREQAANASRPEPPESDTAARVVLVEHQGGEQEAGQREEQRHAEEAARQPRRCLVVDQHRDHGDRPKAVESGPPVLLVGVHRRSQNAE